MEWFDNGWGLAMLIVFPITGATIVALTQPRNDDIIKGVAFVTALSTFMLSVLAARRLSPEPGAEPIIDVFLGGIPGFADRYYVTDFGLRLPILVLFGLVATIVVIYSWNQWQRPSNAKAIVMVTLVVLDILMLELIFEEGTPPAVTAGLLLLKNLHFGRHLLGTGALIRRCRAPAPNTVHSGPRGSLSSRRDVAAHSDVVEEEMSGLVR